MPPAADHHKEDTRALRALLLPWLERVAIGLVCILLGALGSAQLKTSNIGVGINLPPAGPTEQKDPKPPPPSPPMLPERFRVVGLATFGNGSSRLTDDALENVRKWARAISSCKGAEIAVLGSTSSVPYRDGSPHNNQWLGVQRAEAVAAAIRLEAKVVVAVVDAESERGLDGLRGFSDVVGGVLDSDLAAVARRVDMEVVTFGACALPAIKR